MPEMRCLLPPAGNPRPAVWVSFPMALHPDYARARDLHPFALMPDVALAVPFPIAVGPGVLRSGRCRDRFHSRGGRWFRDDDLRRFGNDHRPMSNAACEQHT